MDSDIEEVGRRIGEEMRQLNLRRSLRDKYGSIVGKIGNGPKILLYDTHIDTVGIDGPPNGNGTPSEGKVEDGMLYARGALDEKNSTLAWFTAAMAATSACWMASPATFLATLKNRCDGVRLRLP
ncbi:MAG: M20/M25/M40 family metallo-hydrolase [Anaerolineaceae bacterium]|nr:M20/M25/M40 family metallo-hydrolase [Anaerolineaceae bacterium]